MRPLRPPTLDLYAVLGVSRAATTAELRRAYRRLALQHHPDRAGAASAPVFARVAEAYRMLADPTARAAYDAHLFERESASTRAGGAVRADDLGWNVSSVGWAAHLRRQVSDLLPRLSGTLDDLVAAAAARVDPDGLLELTLTAGEAASGGTAVVTMPLALPCPTCGGVARPGGVWCARCEFAGRVTDAVPVHVRIPPGARDWQVVSGVIDRGGAGARRVRLRVGA